MDTNNDIVTVSSQLKALNGFDHHAFTNLLEDTTPNTVLRILARFCVSLDESIPALEHSKEMGQTETIWKTAHKLAGSAEMLGFKTFGRHSKNLSSQLKNVDAMGMHSEEVVSYVGEARQLAENLSKIFSNQKNYL